MEKPRTMEQARKERWLRQVREARALGDLALQQVDDVLAENGKLYQFPVRPDQDPETDPPPIVA